MAALLDGIRIIDLTSVIMGPFASRILADLGADVVKIESPDGDSVRAHRPHLAPGLSGMFLNLNRNKRSVVLDLKTPAGKNALERLIASANVFMHNLRAPVIERLGFGYEPCRALKPDIVYCAAYGFGAAGPYAAKAAYDDMIQAGSGFASLSESITGSPSYAPSVLCDKVVGQAMANAVLAGLLHRERTGEGQAIEVPMLEVAIDFNLVEHFGAAVFSPPRGEPGYPRICSKNRRPFATADGYACILPYSDRNWRDLFAFIGRGDLLADARFQTIATRQDHFGELYAVLGTEAARRTTAEWVAFCDGVDIPCMAVVALADVFDDPHVRAVDLFSVEQHPAGGAYRSIRRPVNYSAAPFALRRHAPVLGEHTDEVMGEIGLAGAPSE